MSIVIAIAGDQLGKKKQAEVADDQHIRQPRKVIPVKHIIVFEIALQVLFELPYHRILISLPIQNLPVIRADLLRLDLGLEI